MIVGRNEPCPCGSGKKYKKCCLSNEDAKPSPPSRGGYRFEPGSYGSSTDCMPSIACMREGGDDYHFVLVKPDAPLDGPDHACATATADLNDAFARKALTGRDQDAVLLLRDRGYVRVDGHRVAGAGAETTAWLAEDGLHVTSLGRGLSPEALEAASKAYQEKLRSSPLWDEMIKKFGEPEAERLLAQCRVEERDGGA
ncbi:MAG TPA: SEC-C metal-binding domain-containing protein [Polyangiaceae bacterium]|nr:SEC-C metal-binding domain-containing protein [Polyangiaceae bacterium]